MVETINSCLITMVLDKNIEQFMHLLAFPKVLGKI